MKRQIVSSPALFRPSSIPTNARLLVWFLLAGLLLMNGLAVLSLSHAGHHGSHGAHAHHTGLCAWYCAAGQAIEVPSVRVESAVRLGHIVAVPEFDPAEPATFVHSFLRGPPVSAL